MSRRSDIWTFNGILDVLDLSVWFIRFIRIYNKFQGINCIEKPVNEKISFYTTSRNGIMDIFVVVI